MCLRSHLSQMTYFRLSRCLPKDFMRSSRVSVNIEYRLGINMDITKKCCYTLLSTNLASSCGWGSGPPSTRKSQVAIGFLRNTGTVPTREAGPMGPIASLGRFVRPSLKYEDD